MLRAEDLLGCVQLGDKEGSVMWLFNTSAFCLEKEAHGECHVPLSSYGQHKPYIAPTKVSGKTAIDSSLIDL